MFSALINNKKIPFDDVGIGIIESKISAALRLVFLQVDLLNYRKTRMVM